MAQRVLVIGLDGATWDLLKPWTSEGALPNLARLLEEGTAGPLRSTIPPVTCPAWPSFMTGKEPAGHGVFDFVRIDSAFRRSRPRPGAARLVDSTDIGSRLFWEYLSDAGMSCGLLNVPATHPVRAVDGYVVPGLLAPDTDPPTHPENLLRPYEAELGAYRVTPRRTYEPGRDETFLKELSELAALRLRYALRLARDRPTDFTMVHLQVTDIAQHKLWRHLDPSHPWHDPSRRRLGDSVQALFRQIDDGIGELRSLNPDAAVIVLSDHGFGPQTRTVNLNLHLASRGLLTLRPLSGVRRWAARRPWTTRFAQRIWRREHLIDWADVDWDRTRAYAFGHMGQVWCVGGREDRGAVCEGVADALAALEDPETGRPLVDEVIWRDVTDGRPFAELGPDAHVVLDGYRAVAYPMFAADGRIVTEQRRGDSGTHRPDGILVAAGPGIRSGRWIEGARLIDLAPTILHLMGVAVPDDMDGRVIQGLLESSRQPTRQPARPAPLRESPDNNEMDGRVAARLRALGYLGGPDQDQSERDR